MEEAQDKTNDDKFGRILDRNFRVIRPPNELDPGLFDLLLGLKKLCNETKQVNFLAPRLNRIVQQKDGEK